MALVTHQPQRARSGCIFHTGMGVAFVIAILCGFARTFYLRGILALPIGSGPLTPLLIVHGIVATSWIGLFLAQAVLVNRRRITAHRRLGTVGAALAIALVGPALGRLIAFNFDVTLVGFVLANTAFPDVFVVAAILYDLWQRKSVHPALLFGGQAVACFPLLLLVADTAPGLALAGMFQ